MLQLRRLYWTISLLGDSEAAALRELASFPVYFAGLLILNPAALIAVTFETTVQMTPLVSASLRERQPLDAIGFGLSATQALWRAKVEREKEIEISFEPLLAAATPIAA